MRFDATLKQLFQVPGKLLESLTGSRIAEVLTVEFPDVRRRVADLVVRLEDGRIAHFELQSGADSEMPWRMLEYYFLIRKTYKQAPLQFVIYVGNESNPIRSAILEKDLSFSYTVIDLRRVSAEFLLESDLLGDNLLAILCDMKENAQSVIQTVVERVKRAPEKERSDLITKLMILSELRSLEPDVLREVRRMPITVNLLESEYWRGVYEQGISEGRNQGIAVGRSEGRNEGRSEGLSEGLSEGRNHLLRRQLERRFGPLPAWAMEKLRDANAATLDDWGLRLLDSSSLEEALG